MRTRVKICGITRTEDGLAAAKAGADAIGLVFYEASPRNVSLEQAKAIRSALPAFVSVVGLVVNPQPDWVKTIIEEVQVDLMQFHGDEDATFCQSVGRPYIKALRMREDIDVQAMARQYDSASGLLLDSYQTGVPGGTGKPFDWTRIPAGLNKALILAGGLDAENVARAIQQSYPYAVDVSGGVEAQKGIKDHVKIEKFIKEVSNIGTS